MSTEKQKNTAPDAEFAFPRERKEPIHDAAHVRNAIARFDQVEGVTDQERDDAWRRIQAAAKNFGVDMGEEDWRELFRRHPEEPKR
jgi:cell division protein FtsX